MLGPVHPFGEELTSDYDYIKRVAYRRYNIPTKKKNKKRLCKANFNFTSKQYTTRTVSKDSRFRGIVNKNNEFAKHAVGD